MMLTMTATWQDATVMLTGATAGIGRATALALAGRVGRLILHGLEQQRDVRDLLDTLRWMMRPGARLVYLSANYGDLSEVMRLARDVRAATGRIDVLINNAARPGPATRTLSDSGTEVTLQANYLAPVVLTTGLLDLIGDGRPGRIINVASATHLSAVLPLEDLNLAHTSYSPTTAYARSKLALVTYTCWLAAHRPTPSLDVVSMHPGVISTELLHAMFSVGGDPPNHAAANIWHVAGLSNDNGTYYDERWPAQPNPQASDPAMQKRLHDITTRMLRNVLLS